MAWKVRVDFVRLAGPLYASGAGVNNPAPALAAATLSGAGATAVTSDAAPDFGAAGGLPATGFARVKVLSGAVVVAWGDAPTAAEATSLRLEAGEREYLPITTGQRVTFLEAADPPSSTGSGGSGAAASAAFTSRSTTSVANASTSLMPANAVRQAMKIQAPAGADLWVNELGGTAAVNGGDCFSIPAGSLYEPHVASRSAVTYLCAAAGLPIVASEA